MSNIAKKIISSIIFILCVYNLHAQNSYLDFEKEFKYKNIKIKNADSYKISYEKCVASYDGFYRSDVAYDRGLLELLDKKNIRIYREIKKIRDACILYQENKNGEKIELFFDLYTNVASKEFDLFKNGQLVECDIMIITLCNGENKQTKKFYFITSMKKIE